MTYMTTKFALTIAHINYHINVINKAAVFHPSFPEGLLKSYPPQNLIPACTAIQYNSISCLFYKVDQALNPALLILPGA